MIRHFNHLFCLIGLLLLYAPTFLLAQNDSLPPNLTNPQGLEKAPGPINLNEVKLSLHYPVVAMKEGLEGKVVVRILVDPSGKYVSHTVLSSDHYSFTQEVSKRIPNLIFTPGIVDGRPVRALVTIPFDFSFDKEKEIFILPPIFTKQKNKKIEPLNFKEVRSEMGYPKKLQRKQVEGKVGMEIRIDPQGNPLSHSLLFTENSDKRLVKLVEKHIHKLHFPADKSAKKPRTTKVYFKFKLNDPRFN